MAKRPAGATPRFVRNEYKGVARRKGGRETVSTTQKQNASRAWGPSRPINGKREW